MDCRKGLVDSTSSDLDEVRDSMALLHVLVPQLRPSDIQDRLRVATKVKFVVPQLFTNSCTTNVTYLDISVVPTFIFSAQV